MSWLLMEKLLRHQQSVRSSEGCCVDRLSHPLITDAKADDWRGGSGPDYGHSAKLFDHLVGAAE